MLSPRPPLNLQVELSSRCKWLKGLFQTEAESAPGIRFNPASTHSIFVYNLFRLPTQQKLIISAVDSIANVHFPDREMGNTFSSLKQFRGSSKRSVEPCVFSVIWIEISKRALNSLPLSRTLNPPSMGFLRTNSPPFLERLAFPDSHHVVQIWGPDLFRLLSSGLGQGETRDQNQSACRMRTGQKLPDPSGMS